MMQRTGNPKNSHYAYYGGRGVTVCDAWKTFDGFLAAMGERPEGTTLDRYPNNDGNYEPGNVRWATKREQMRNTRMVKLTPEIVRSIRKRVAAGESGRAIGRELGLSAARASRIARRLEWGDVTDEP